MCPGTLHFIKIFPEHCCPMTIPAATGLFSACAVRRGSPGFTSLSRSRNVAVPPRNRVYFYLNGVKCKDVRVPGGWSSAFSLSVPLGRLGYRSISCKKRSKYSCEITSAPCFKKRARHHSGTEVFPATVGLRRDSLRSSPRHLWGVEPHPAPGEDVGRAPRREGRVGVRGPSGVPEAPRPGPRQRPRQSSTFPSVSGARPSGGRGRPGSCRAST